LRKAHHATCVKYFQLLFDVLDQTDVFPGGLSPKKNINALMVD